MVDTYQKSSGDFKNVKGVKNKATNSTIIQKLTSNPLINAFIKSWIFFEASNKNTTAVPNKLHHKNIETIVLKCKSSREDFTL